MLLHFFGKSDEQSLVALLHDYGFTAVLSCPALIWLSMSNYKYSVYSDGRFAIYIKRLGSRMNPMISCVLVDGDSAFVAKMNENKLQHLIISLRQISEKG